MPAIFKLLLISVLCLPRAVYALELFGVDLENTSREELRAAVAQAGVLLLREAGEEEWYDIYDSSSVVNGSTHLYLGFVKSDQVFAFAEYEFRGIHAKSLAILLRQKYGNAEVRQGQYMSDRSYRWQLDGIEISLTSDWQNYKTRLSYVDSDNLARLQAEQYGTARKEESTAFSLF